MRRIFAIALFALLLGVGVVALIETDPGYVLVAYGNYTLESSLWVGLLLLFALILLVYLALRLVFRLVGGQRSLVSWLGTRKTHHAARLSTRGLINFLEGNWARSRRQVLKGATNNEAPLLNYLLAARASHHLGEPDKVSQYLGAAADAESAAVAAVELAEAEIKVHAGQYDQALAVLDNMGNASSYPRAAPGNLYRAGKLGRPGASVARAAQAETAGSGCPARAGKRHLPPAAAGCREG
jgi:HemY protein